MPFTLASGLGVSQVQTMFQSGLTDDIRHPVLLTAA
jgi:hypothetical protein